MDNEKTKIRGTKGGKKGKWEPYYPKKSKTDTEFGYTERDKAAMKKAGVL